MRELGPTKLLLSLLVALIVALASCGGNVASVNNVPTNTGSGAASSQYDVCNCTPTEDPSGDYRHDQKHIPLPNMTPQEIMVSDILSWPQNLQPRTVPDRLDRELQLFHIAQAFLQNVYVNPGDCDIHLELSQVADKNAPRVIVETPGDPSYCSARQNLQQQLAARSILLPAGGDLNPPATVDVVGMAFEDYGHQRGSPQVATVWELHPAIVKITGQ